MIRISPSLASRASLMTVIVITAVFSAPASGQAGDAPRTVIPPNCAPVAVREWLVSGEFPSPRVSAPPPEGPTGAGFNVDYLASLGGETAARPTLGTTISLPGGKSYGFSRHQWEKPYIDFNLISKTPRDVCIYIYAELESPVEQVVYAHVGTNSAGKAWVGGKPIVDFALDRVAMPSQHVVQVTLKAGRTPVLVKIDHDGGGWGAFFEVYGRDAQAEFYKRNAPRQLVVESNDYLPNPGKNVALRITNWAPPEPDQPVTWEAIKGDQIERLDSITPDTAYTIAEPSDAVVVLRARTAHPEGGEAIGECVLLTGGVDASKRALDRFANARHAITTPESLSGTRRDAFALALYHFERLAPQDLVPDWTKLNLDNARNVALLRTNVDAFEQFANPYSGKTGLFEGAYLSNADATAQPFMLSIPRSYMPSRPYALLVYLHGAGQIHETPNGWWQPAADTALSDGTIAVAVLGRGRYGRYVGLAEYDVLEAVDWVLTHYSIDQNRVYLAGSSMGGGGVWRLAAQYPDRFAAAMADCGYADLRLLPNLSNLPFYANHGAVDTTVPVVWSRLATDRLAALGSPVVYTEYPGVDHAVGIPVTKVGYMTRLATHTRVTAPDHVRIGADHPRQARINWGQIAQWADPHLPAALEAAVFPGNVVSVGLSNVSEARLAPPARYLNPDGDITWMVGKRRIVSPHSAAGRYDIVCAGNEIAVRPQIDIPVPELRRYVQGSYMELYRGEPLMIVYGTKGPDTVQKTMKAMARELARMSSPGCAMAFGGVPTVADTELTEEQAARCNLIVIGGPTQNVVTRRLMNLLPIREDNDALRIFDAPPVSLAGRGYAFMYPNPEHPSRLLFVIASLDASYYTYPQKDAVNAIHAFDELWRDPFIPDLFVETLDSGKGNRYARLLYFTHGWRPEPASTATARRQPASLAEYDEMVAEAFRRAGHAAYALCPRGDHKQPCPYVGGMPWRDISLLTTCQPFLSFDVTGRQLTEFAKRWKGSNWAVLPAPNDVAPDARYRVAAPPNLLWMLGGVDIAISPSGVIDDPDLFAKSMREVWQVKD